MDPEPIPIIECGCCCCYHRVAYTGDCRNDEERFGDPQDAADILQRPIMEVYEDGGYDPYLFYPKGAQRIHDTK